MGVGVGVGVPLSITLCTHHPSTHFDPQVITQFWAGGDVKNALRHLLQMREPTASAVASDVLRSVQLRSAAFTLESCSLLLPFLCRMLLATKFEDYMIVAVCAAQTLLETFGDVIADTIRVGRQSQESGRGVEPSLEERLARCEVCHRSLLELQHPVTELVAGAGRGRRHARGGELDQAAQKLKGQLEAFVRLLQAVL